MIYRLESKNLACKRGYSLKLDGLKIGCRSWTGVDTQYPKTEVYNPGYNSSETLCMTSFINHVACTNHNNCLLVEGGNFLMTSKWPLVVLLLLSAPLRNSFRWRSPPCSISKKPIRRLWDEVHHMLSLQVHTSVDQ
jgi:hypothetical protein